MTTETSIEQITNIQGDRHSWVLAMASIPVAVRDTSSSRRKTVSAFEARLIELGTPGCRRRLFCQDFVWLVMKAASMSAGAFNADIDQLIAERKAAVARHS